VTYGSIIINAILIWKRRSMRPWWYWYNAFKTICLCRDTMLMPKMLKFDPYEWCCVETDIWGCIRVAESPKRWSMGLCRDFRRQQASGQQWSMRKKVDHSRCRWEWTAEEHLIIKSAIMSHGQECQAKTYHATNHRPTSRCLSHWFVDQCCWKRILFLARFVQQHWSWQGSIADKGLRRFA